MESRRNRVAVFGIGGAGCKILKSLEGKLSNNSELLALDTDKKQLDSLGEGIRTVLIGKNLDKVCGDSGGIRKALEEDIRAIEEELEDVGTAIIIAGLGGKTGTCIGDFISDFCMEKELFTLVMPIYPLTKMKGAGEEADNAIKRLMRKSDGVIIADNNLKRDERLPMLSVFGKVNAVVMDLITLIAASLSGMGTTNLGKDELQAFFYGDYYFIITEGSWIDVKTSAERALKEIASYSDSKVEKVLVLAKSPYDVGIEDMRKVNSSINDKISPEGIKWIADNARDNNTKVILISAVKELPLVEGVKMPKEILGEEFEAGKVNVDYGFPQERTEDALEETVLEKETKEVRSQALIGLHEEEKRTEEKSPEKEGDPETIKPAEEAEEDIEDVISEISGFPSFKKKEKKEGQKKLGDYDEWGIGYI